MNRRSFIQSVLALAAAPAIVRADSLMRIVPREWIVAPVMSLDGLQWTQEEIRLLMVAKTAMKDFEVRLITPLDARLPHEHPAALPYRIFLPASQ